MPEGATVLARAVSDGEDRLVMADEPLAGLQMRCGGKLPGTIAIPALLELVRKSRRFALKLSRSILACDKEERIDAWIESQPRSDGEPGCELRVMTWHAEPLEPVGAAELENRAIEIDRHCAEFVAKLDASQNVMACNSEAADLGELEQLMRDGIGEPWTSFVNLQETSHRQPMHWRLLDGAMASVPGSDRQWRVRLVPQVVPGADPVGFDLMLMSDQALPILDEHAADANQAENAAARNLIGQDVAPVLRRPISRIIANAETIRTRLAGPISDDYAAYAKQIADAGKHLLELLDDLSDLEIVESESFTTAPDQIDLAEVARQASGILGVRAKERNIVIDAPKMGETLPALAEFRRVLQILLNLIANAIRYTPRGSQIWIRLEDEAQRARVIVADQGPGLSEQQTDVIFEKFERLGRSGDGGSGLGLYISRRLARAMGGDLTVESAPGQGARFILELPGDMAE